MNTLAKQMSAYIKRRAEVEGVQSCLTPEWFEGAIPRASKIFGITHDGKKMLSDEQEPHPGFFSDFVEEIERLNQ